MSSAATSTDLPETPPQNNPFVFLLNIPQCLINSLKNFNKTKQEKKVEIVVKSGDNNNNNNTTQEKKVEIVVKSVDNNNNNNNNTTQEKSPDVVSFPLVKYVVPPIKLENDDVVKEDTNPIILWQVYALGGFIILKWAWGKWQERKAKAKDDSPDENDPPADA